MLIQMDKKISDALKQRASFPLNTQSRSESVKTKRANGTFVAQKNLDDELMRLKVSWWPIDLPTAFPEEGSEDDVCQPFVKELLELFVDGEVMVKTDNKKSKSRIVTIKSVPDPESYKHYTGYRRAPDAIFYDGHKRGDLAVTLLGEVKGCKNQDNFPDSEIGQLLDSLSRMMRHQPFRMFAFGFLTDGNRFLFVRCYKYEEEEKFEHSSIFRGKIAWQVSLFQSAMAGVD